MVQWRGMTKLAEGWLRRMAGKIDSSRVQRLGLAAMMVVMLVTAFLRLEAFTTLPPGTHNDIAQNIDDGLRISRSGTFPLMLDTRPEPLWRLLLAGAVWWTGGAPFTERLAGIAIGLLTVAASYRATIALLRLWPGNSARARVWGGIVTATALAANVPLEFINRQGYRAGLLPLAVALLIWAWAHALRTGRLRAYFVAGLAAGFPVSTYTAGLVVPPIAVLSLVYLWIVGVPDQRPRWRQLGMMLAALGLALLPELILVLLVPDLYWRVRAAQSYSFGAPAPDQWSPVVQSLGDLLQRARVTFEAFFVTGYPYPDYNTRISPFMYPLFALLAGCGLLAALRHWRRLPLPLIGGLLLGLMLPGTLSMTPNNPIRLSGTFVPLAVLAGMGACELWLLIERLALPRRRSVSLAFGAGLLLTLISGPVVARQQFNAHWQTESLWADPEYWLSFPHYYSVNLNDLLNLLKAQDQAVYVPMSIIDTASAAWYLTAEAYPQVGFAAPDQLAALPEGELWYPYAGEFNVPLSQPAEQFALLQPGPDHRGGQITILPPIAPGAAAALQAQVQQDGQTITNARDWTLGWRMPVNPATVTAAPSTQDWHPVGARFGDVVELVGYEAPLNLQAGERLRVTFYWRVLKTMNFDLFSNSSLLDADLQVRAEDNDVWLYHWLHPSVFWQPGDVVSDVRWLEVQADAPQGLYSLFVSLYTPPGIDQLLPVYDASGQRLADPWLALRNHRIPLPAVRVPDTAIPVRAQFGSELNLVAYESDTPLDSVKAGDSVHLHLYWQATAQPSADYSLFLHVTDREDRMVAQQDLQPENGRYPTHIWRPGETVAVDYQITIPADAAFDTLSWRAGAYSFPSLERLPVTQDGQAPEDRRAWLRPAE